MKKIIPLIFIGLFSSGIYAQTIVSLTDTGYATWTVPSGLAYATVYLWGGGGGGGTSVVDYPTNWGEAGGGGGGACSVNHLAVTAGQTWLAYVGPGGLGGGWNGMNWSGLAGHRSTLVNGGTTLFATGGLGGDSSTGANTASSGGAGGNGGTGTVYSGGNGSRGLDNTGVCGNGGGGAGSGGNGVTPASTCYALGPGGSGTYHGGYGGSMPLCASHSDQFGIGGAAPGGGGSSSNVYSFSRGGGNGGNGQILISYDLSIWDYPFNQSVCPGSQVILTSAASGISPITVQWQVSTNGGINYTDMPGANTDTFYFTASAADNGNWYRAMFTNAAGSAPTSAAMLTVLTNLPSITLNPAPQTVCAGSSVTFTAAATGTPTPTVQWQVSSDGGATYSDIAGATSTTLSFTAASGQNGNLYQAVFTGQCSSTSSAAMLTVTTPNTPSAILQSSLPGPIYQGNSVTFTATPFYGGSSPVFAFYINGIQVQVGPLNTLTIDTFSTFAAVSVTVYSNASCIAPDSGSGPSLLLQVYPNTWTGAVSTAWANAANWTYAVPTSTIDAYIPGGLSRYPIISATANAQSVTINAGASLTINSGQLLSVFGCWTNNGTASVGNSGSVSMQGGGSQTISGITIFNNLNINGNYTISLGFGSNVSVAGILNKTGGTLYTNNALTLLSSSTQTALVEESGGSLFGAATMQRYFAGSKGYHLYSSPMSNSYVGSLSGFPITGLNGVGSFIHNMEGTFQQFEETNDPHATIDSGFYNYTSSLDPLVPGTGYTAVLNTVPAIVSCSGNLNNGPLSVNITKTGSRPGVSGWNQVGNPYPSPISWSALRSLNSGISLYPSCYLWQATGLTSGTWVTFNGVGGTHGLGNIISSGQGFWVEITSGSSASLNFNNSVRTLDLSPYYYEEPAALENELRLTISSSKDPGCEALTYTDASGNSSSAVMPPMPSFSQSPTLCFAGNDENDLIYVSNEINENTSMPLVLHTGAEGMYTIAASSIKVSGLPVYLYDAATNHYYDLSRETATINSSGQEDISGRYSVVYKKSAADRSDLTTSIWGEVASIAVSRADAAGTAQVSVTDLLGREVANVSFSGIATNIPMPDNYAVYLVTVRDNGKETIKKVLVKQ